MILSVRCIIHEGTGYASSVMIRPIPVKELLQGLLVWQKVSGQPMAISKLPPLKPGNVTEGLVKSFVASTRSLLTNLGNEDEMHITRSNCIKTAMLVLQTFMSSIKNPVNDYHFCEPLYVLLY